MEFAFFVDLFCNLIYGSGTTASYHLLCENFQERNLWSLTIDLKNEVMNLFSDVDC